MEKKNKFEGAYESPELNVLDLNVEGVLCMSGEGSFNDLKRGDDIL